MNDAGHDAHRDAGVLIAGGGLAAQRAAETLRRSGYDGAIRIVAGELDAPYDRPPLSKEFLTGEVGDEALRFRPDAWYAEQRVELLLGERAAGLDPRAREVVLSSGPRLPFSRLLIATGSAPRRLPGTESFANVHELRTLRDARRLRGAVGPGARVVVVGAGFIGQEVAATARRRGAEVTIVEAAPAPLAAVLGTELGGWFAQLHREEDVEVLLSAQIVRLHGNGAVRSVELAGGRRLACDALVVGIGTQPATAWLERQRAGRGRRAGRRGRAHVAARDLRGRRCKQAVRRTPSRARAHGALGGRRAPGRRRRPRDARAAAWPGGRAELLERPARRAHPVPRPRPRRRRGAHRR